MNYKFSIISAIFLGSASLLHVVHVIVAHYAQKRQLKVAVIIRNIFFVWKLLTPLTYSPFVMQIGVVGHQVQVQHLATQRKVSVLQQQRPTAFIKNYLLY